jgi:hypothetical protein
MNKWWMTLQYRIKNQKENQLRYLFIHSFIHSFLCRAFAVVASSQIRVAIIFLVCEEKHISCMQYIRYIILCTLCIIPRVFQDSSRWFATFKDIVNWHFSRTPNSHLVYCCVCVCLFALFCFALFCLGLIIFEKKAVKK